MHRHFFNLPLTTNFTYKDVCLVLLMLIFITPSVSYALPIDNEEKILLDHHNIPSNWIMWKQKENLSVDYQDIANSDLIMIRAKSSIKSKLSALLLFLQDTKNIPYWLQNATSSKIIKKISPQENISTTTFDAFWPVKTREMIIRSQYWQNKDLTVEVSINDASEYYYQYKSKDAIPITIISAHWYIIPSSLGVIDIEYTIIANPNGSIPNWLANRIALKSTWKTLINIEKQLPKSVYQKQSLVNIKELEVN